MGKRECMFCGGGRLTSAHLISESLQRLLPPVNMPTSRQDIWLDPESMEWRTRHREINISPGNHQVKRLCQPCNGEWMTRFELATRDVLVEMSAASEITLTPELQLALSTWATIVAMLRATQDPGRRFITDADARVLRHTDTPPPGYGVWLVRTEFRPDVSMRHVRIETPEGLGWFSWIWFGQVMIGVSSTILAARTGRRLGILPSAAISIHPATGAQLWPAANQVPTETILELMTHR